LQNEAAWDASPFNIGGGRDVSVSLVELTALCNEVTGVKREIGSLKETSTVDIPIYLSDCDRARRVFGWRPKRNPKAVVADICEWIRDNENDLRRVL
jgi:CDP-paratose 2-epimerase